MSRWYSRVRLSVRHREGRHKGAVTQGASVDFLVLHDVRGRRRDCTLFLSSGQRPSLGPSGASSRRGRHIYESAERTPTGCAEAMPPRPCPTSKRGIVAFVNLVRRMPNVATPFILPSAHAPSNSRTSGRTACPVSNSATPLTPCSPGWKSAASGSEPWPAAGRVLEPAENEIEPVC